MANPSGALWSWSVDGLVAPREIHAVLSAMLARPVVPLGGADAPPYDALLCDVWYTSGDFPTRVDCYLAPGEPAEIAAAAAFARRLGRRCLLPDDTLDAGRFLLAAPDGTLRPVHLDVTDGDDGLILSRLRPCTMADQRERSVCRQSRWAPDSVVPGLAAA
ncbi:MAG TPA: hypothetical protein VFX61_18910 [Micromonosporaceae bacterium]|nr:hypothetical protein [Micromonosporaceae bacterium]